jgi:hypothetical protein
VPFGRFHVAAGGLLGAGTMTATLTRMPDGDRAWPDIVDATTVSRQVLSATYLSWQPWLTCEFDVNPFLVVGVTGGWYGGTPTSWTYNDALTATGVPSFSFAGPFLRADVTAGLFIGE